MTGSVRSNFAKCWENVRGKEDGERPMDAVGRSLVATSRAFLFVGLTGLAIAVIELAK